jgi:hypothetical protein
MASNRIDHRGRRSDRIVVDHDDLRHPVCDAGLGEE